MYLSLQAQIASSNFSLPIAYHFQSKLDGALLTRCLEDLINQHEILFSKIIEDNGDVFFEVQSKISLDLEIKKTNLSFAVNDYEEDAKLGFNLRTGPLFRVKIYEIDNQFTVLYINFHHLIYDGHSSRIFMRELEQRYSAFLSNEKFIRKENKNLINPPPIDPNLVKTLKSFYTLPIPVLELPNNFNEVNLSEENEIESLNLEFPLDQLAKVEKTCLELGVSLYHFYSYAFSILLARYSGQKSFAIGTPVLGRHSKKELNEIGFFANTMALPISLDWSSSLSTGLKENAQSINEIFKYKKVPYGDLIASIGNTSLYQTFLMYQDFSSQVQSFSGVSYKRTHLSSGTSHSELDLWLTKYDGEIKGGFHYKKSRFSKEIMSKMLESFLFVIDQICDDREVSLSVLPTLSDLKQKTLIDKFSNINKGSSEYFLNTFKTQVEKFPEKLAILNENSKTSYKELDYESDQLASYLLGLGIVPGCILGVCLPRSKNILVSYLAILKLDCSFLPIDPSFPKDRIEYMISHAKLDYVINEKISNYLFRKIKSIDFSFFLKNLKSISPLEYRFKGLGSNTAYILFTSGSTGRPKGVEVSAHAMNNFLNSMLVSPGITSNDSLIALTTISFDISILEFFLPLISGASIYIASKEEAVDGNVLNKLISKYKINFMQATPITWRMLLETGLDGRKGFKALCGGEKLPIDLAISLSERCSEAWNMYGPTETTIWSTIKKLDATKLENISIGSPINNTSIYILDKNRNMINEGAIGEIYIAGSGVAKGYLNEPNLTEKNFFIDPYHSNGKRRMYRTGDLGRFFQGELLCLGRVDNQVKINGYRIELDEVNFALNRIGSIKDSYSMVRENGKKQSILVAYIVLVEQKDYKPEDYYNFLKKILPYYMIPTQYIVMNSFPLTESGKIDHKLFPNQTEKVLGRGTGPRSRTEIKLALIWQKELKIKKLSLEDEFFEIGGNSLMAASIFKGISNEFNLNMELSSLISYSSLGKLANRIDSLLKDKTNVPDFTNLVKLLDGGEVPKGNFYFFHAIGGNTLNYRVFFKALAGHNVYGLQCTGVDGKNIKYRPVSEMATIYIGEMLKLGLKGPFNLAGGSFGGFLVHEVARQLIARGHRVAKLIMFDTNSPGLNERNTLGGARINFLSFLNFIYQRLNITTPHSVRYKLIEYLNLRAAKSFEAKLIKVDLLLLRGPLEKSGKKSMEDLGWGQYINGDIEVKYIKAGHDDFIESSKVVTEFKNSLDL